MANHLPFRYHGLDHVVLKVTQIERTLQFYTEVLGMKLERIIEDFGIYQLRCGRHLIDLQVLPPGGELAAKAMRGMDHVCVLIDGDMGAILDHLAAHDVPVEWGPVELYGATGFGTSVYVPDPDGHTIELKVDHADYPLRTSGRDAMAALTRPPPKPRP
jgi:catechol 2,3-dioxygenase-like lactoylglutathione lyase family enzyme